MHDDLNTMDAVAIAERIRDGALSAEEATRAAIARIEQLDPEIGAIAHRDFERALERARGRHRRHAVAPSRASSGPRGPTRSAATPSPRTCPRARASTTSSATASSPTAARSWCTR